MPPAAPVPNAFCEDVGVPALAIGIVVFFLRRLRPTTVALIAYRTWRRLPPEQRQALVVAARRNGPRLASSLARRARPRG
jgi:hypothetical protein